LSSNNRRRHVRELARKKAPLEGEAKASIARSGYPTGGRAQTRPIASD
jgi:hypothetical protein